VLLPGAPSPSVRWRSVRRDGTRFPPVGELGVVIAQARFLARADGACWIVGSDHHTVEIRNQTAQTGTGTQGTAGLAVIGVGPRWSQTVARVLST
jgi:hypothetical protein